MKAAFGLASVARLGRRLSILAYHRVLPQPDPLRWHEVDAAEFRWQMEVLKEYFNVLPLPDALAQLRRRDLPPRAVSITFDDGYADNAEVALPILNEYGFTATFFVATGYLDGGIMWNDVIVESVRTSTRRHLDLRDEGHGDYALTSDSQKREFIGQMLPRLMHLRPEERDAKARRLAARLGGAFRNGLMMQNGQVQQLAAAGMEIGGHTVSHPVLTTVSVSEGAGEIEEGRRRLSDLTGRPVRLFAYPSGRPGRDYMPEHVRVVREMGFDGAVATAWGALGANDDIFQMPRFRPWDRTKSRFILRMARNYVRRPHVIVPES